MSRFTDAELKEFMKQNEKAKAEADKLRAQQSTLAGELGAAQKALEGARAEARKYEAAQAAAEAESGRLARELEAREKELARLRARGSTKADDSGRVAEAERKVKKYRNLKKEAEDTLQGLAAKIASQLH